MNFDPFIFGKEQTDSIVAIEMKDDRAYIYRELEDEVIEEIRDIKNPYWVLYPSNPNDNFGKLKGDLHYKYFNIASNRQIYQDEVSTNYRYQSDFFTIKDDTQRLMAKSGFTLFLSQQVQQVSVLSFDIETTGINLNKDSKVLMISNTYKKNDTIIKKLFVVEDYKNQKEMINEWTKWVRQVDPSIMVGHNIFGFDLNYLKYCAGGSLKLGRDGSNLKVARYTSKFRKDGSQEYDYNNMRAFGRQIIDTMFLSIKYDVGRKYPSYGLKAIIESEGLVKDNRQFYDASKIKDNWSDPVERQKIIEYGKDDADDALALYELMIPQFFYLTQSVPKSLQSVINGGTGGLVNSFMIRAYLQDRHSIPKATTISEKDDNEEHENTGGISYGNPGIYENVFKVDIASMYPSVILAYDIYDTKKDPNRVLTRMVKYFLNERLSNKLLAKNTGDVYYKNLSDSQKVFINSIYGMFKTRGINFNNESIQKDITSKSREILQSSIEWAFGFRLEEYVSYIKNKGKPNEEKEYSWRPTGTHPTRILVNCDTDSFSIKEPGLDCNSFLKKLNEFSLDGITWADDGFFESVVVVKAKNYALKQGNKISIKGSGLKATMKEPALREFNSKVLERLLTGVNDIEGVYQGYAKEIARIDDIARWASKKTVTKAVLEPKRTNERRVLDAIGDKHVQEGDKIHVFFRDNEHLELAENFDGCYDKDRLYEKLFKTVKVFETVLDIKQFPNYKLKRNRENRP